MVELLNLIRSDLLDRIKDSSDRKVALAYQTTHAKPTLETESEVIYFVLSDYFMLLKIFCYNKK